MEPLPPAVVNGRAASHVSLAMRDVWQLELTTHSARSVRALEGAILGYAGHRADVIRHLETALTADSGLALAHVMRGFGLRFLARRELMEGARAALAQAERSLRERGGTLRENLLVGALSAFCDGDIRSALAALSRSSALHPCCLLSAKLLHALCFMTGETQRMRSHAERAVRAAPSDMQGYGYLLGCYAFALEETHDYRAAERFARQALELNSTDAWAYHAWLHVMASEERNHEGLHMLRARGQRFEGVSNFGAHIAWHHALFAIAEGKVDEALALYDSEIVAPLGTDYRDHVNCVSLLARLECKGACVQDRWQRLAELAMARLSDHSLAFADVHCVLALVQAGRHGEATTFVGAMRRSAESRADHEARLALEVGIPLAVALLSLRQDAERAGIRMQRAAASLVRLGGSHAQRALFEHVVSASARAERDGARGRKSS